LRQAYITGRINQVSIEHENEAILGFDLPNIIKILYININGDFVTHTSL